ncbi:hypothetical protein BC830DRAFT_1138583 [Chytriomyces sp. MP71]|nr:hypothetical protein BC830DRAFT_1138583 [Chytriomyces sp. MP71]
MGKAGKQRKKLKQQTATLAGTKRGGDSSSDDETGAGAGEAVLQIGAESVRARDVDTTLAVLRALSAHPEALRGTHFKPLRAVLHSLRTGAAAHAGIGAGTSLAGKVSDAVSDHRWQDAMDALSEMRAQRQYPRLGALQRWVRDCDAVASTTTHRRDGIVMRVLDAILRTADPTTNGALTKWTSDDVRKIDVIDGVRMLGSWDPYPDREEKDEIVQAGTVVQPTTKDVAHYKPLWKVISHEEGPDRRPANHYPMIIYTSNPSIIDYSSNVAPKKLQAPILPDTLIIQNLLTLKECRQMLLAAESAGFTPDEPVTDTANGRSILAHNVVWLTDPKLTQTIAERASPFLPPTMAEDGDVHTAEATSFRVLEGINPRWRVYRAYDAETETYTFDASEGKTWSRLTFLVYLNEGFEGGETAYFVPSRDTVGVMDAKSVVPRAGCAMVFPHGSVKGNLLHEGSGVLKGTKYIARTDVLYRKTES